MLTSFKEIPQPQAINHFPKTVHSTSLYTDLHTEEQGAGLARVLSAASNKHTGKGQASTKGTEL